METKTKKKKRLRSSTIVLVGSYALTSFTIAAVVILLLLGSDSVKEMIQNGLIAIGGSIGTVFLAWLSRRLLRDENGNGIPDSFEAISEAEDEEAEGEAKDEEGDE